MSTSNAKLVLIKNAIANLVRGGAAALIALLLPPFLTRLMSPAAFGAWSLVLQLAAYVSFLDFGIQTAVSRFVAHATERNDLRHRDEIINTALCILSISGFLAWLGSILLAFFLPQIFRQFPPDLINQARSALVLVAGSLAIGLPASVFVGVFIGLQKNTVPALIIGLSKSISAVFVVVIAWHHGTLAQMGAAFCITNLLSYGFQYLACSRAVPDINFSLQGITRAAAMELLDYCFSLTVWAIGLLLVTGLDLAIVGHYRFNQVAYYSIASTIVTFLGGFYNAIVSPMMPAAAVLHARGDQNALSRIVMVTTRYGMTLLLLTGLPLILGMQPLLKLWVGASYAAQTTTIAQILCIANIIRLCITPYTIAMIGSGDQRRVILTPLLEGISNLLCSLVAGYFLGAVGVALGTLVGAAVGLTGMIFYNMPRTSIQLNIAEFSRASLIRPSIAIIPALIFEVALKAGLPISAHIEVILRITALALGLFLLWEFGLNQEERHRLINRLRQFQQP